MPIDYNAIASAGGFGKTAQKKPKESAKLKQKKPLKSNNKPVPLELKREVLRIKGNFCLAGFCPICGGRAIVTEHDDAHHYPHRSRGGKDCVEHLWLMRHECHMELHLHPLIEKQVFAEILQKANEMLKKADKDAKRSKKETKSKKKAS